VAIEPSAAIEDGSNLSSASSSIMLVIRDTTAKATKETNTLLNWNQTCIAEHNFTLIYLLWVRKYSLLRHKGGIHPLQ
jgi:hypothetical protein